MSLFVVSGTNSHDFDSHHDNEIICSIDKAHFQIAGKQVGRPDT
jgi:hypothetical protein